MIDVTVATISKGEPNQPYYCFGEFKKSLNGFPITWLDTSDYTGLSCRPRIFHNAIKSGIINTEYCILCDSWDLVFIDTPEKIIERFKKMDCDVIISAERNSFPLDYKDEFDKLPFTKSYKYLNCGVIVGKTESVRKMFEDMDTDNIPRDTYDEVKGWNYPNEQSFYQASFLRQPVNIKLDYDQEITWCLHDVGVNELGYAQGRIYCNETVTFPSIAHFNGGAKTSGVREPILEHLKLA